MRFESLFILFFSARNKLSRKSQRKLVNSDCDAMTPQVAVGRVPSSEELLQVFRYSLQSSSIYLLLLFSFIAPFLYFSQSLFLSFFLYLVSLFLSLVSFYHFVVSFPSTYNLPRFVLFFKNLHVNAIRSCDGGNKGFVTSFEVASALEKIGWKMSPNEVNALG